MERREVEEQQIEFEHNQIVWAKITGYPWWPARITQMPSIKTHANYRVDFFNDHTHAFLSHQKMIKYEDMRTNIDLHRQNNKSLRKAIGVADKLFYKGRTPAVHSHVAIHSVEDPFPKQKQLLKSPQVQLTLLQENIKSEIAQQEQHQSQSSEQSSPEEQLLPHLKYSHEQRQQYVTTLLKKYRLITIPKVPEPIAVKTSIKSMMRVSRKRMGKSQFVPKQKIINKIPFEEKNFHYLLTRKIYSLLKKKAGLSSKQRKQISLSLTRQTLNSEGSEEVNELFKWLSVSSQPTIASFYQNWGCMHQEKEKSSNMTTEE